MGVLLLAGCGRVGGEPFVGSVNAALPLHEGTALGQTFRPATGSVRGVDLLVATFGSPPDPDGVLEVDLRESPSGEILGEAQVPGTALDDNQWVAVTFGEPVEVAETAVFEVRWRGAGTVGLWANTPPGPPGHGALLHDPYPGGELLRGGGPANGDLAFRIRGSAGPANAVRAAGRLGSDATASLTAQPGFFLAWLALLAICGALAGLGFGHYHRRRPVELGERRPHHERGDREETGP